MRTFVALVLVVAGIASGCAGEQQQRLQDAERERLYGAPPSIGWSPLGPDPYDQRTRSR